MWEALLGSSTPPHTSLVLRVIPTLLTSLGFFSSFWTNTLLNVFGIDTPSISSVWINSSSKAQQPCKATASETELPSHVPVASKLYGTIKRAAVNLERRDVIDGSYRPLGWNTHISMISMESVHSPDWAQSLGCSLCPFSPRGERPAALAHRLCTEERDCHLLRQPLHWQTGS